MPIYPHPNGDKVGQASIELKKGMLESNIADRPDQIHGAIGDDSKFPSKNLQNDAGNTLPLSLDRGGAV